MYSGVWSGQSEKEKLFHTWSLQEHFTIFCFHGAAKQKKGKRKTSALKAFAYDSSQPSGMEYIFPQWNFNFARKRNFSPDCSTKATEKNVFRGRTLSREACTLLRSWSLFKNLEPKYQNLDIKFQSFEWVSRFLDGVHATTRKLLLLFWLANGGSPFSM